MRRFMLMLIRWFGGFALARLLTRRGLRILCYHGLSLEDEHLFCPALFIHPAEFSRRLQHLARKGYAVLPLADALQRLDAGTLPDRPVSITFDDGFYSTLSVALPLLRARRMPATLYLSTYYVVNQQPVYNLALSYCFWRTTRSEIDLRTLPLPPSLATLHPWGAMTSGQRRALVAALSANGHHADGALGRAHLLSEIASRLGVDASVLSATRALSFVSASEVRLLHEAGIRIELHTHRHHSPGSRAQALRELRENRDIVEALTGHRALHFCYPSGRTDKWDDEWLSALDITSATSTTAGFNYPHTPRLHLRRFLDGADIAQIEFEAELAGVFEVGRRLKHRLRELTRS